MEDGEVSEVGEVGVVVVLGGGEGGGAGKLLEPCLKVPQRFFYAAWRRKKNSTVFHPITPNSSTRTNASSYDVPSHVYFNVTHAARMIPTFIHCLPLKIEHSI